MLGKVSYSPDEKKYLKPRKRCSSNFDVYRKPVFEIDNERIRLQSCKPISRGKEKSPKDFFNDDTKMQFLILFNIDVHCKKLLMGKCKNKLD